MKETTFVTKQNSAKELSVETIKKYICPAASEQESFLFLSKCKALGANPFIGEAYLIKYGTAPATMVIGKDFFIKRADDFPEFDGFEAGVVIEGSANKESVELFGTIVPSTSVLTGGWSRVYRKDRSRPFYVSVKLEEYQKDQGNWKKMPGVMIRKVALVSALREAFPNQFSGAYDEAELEVQLPEPTELKNEVIEVKEGLPFHTPAIKEDKKEEPLPATKAEWENIYGPVWKDKKWSKDRSLMFASLYAKKIGKKLVEFTVHDVSNLSDECWRFIEKNEKVAEAILEGKR